MTMSPEPWLYAGVALLASVHLVVLVYAYRSRPPVGRDPGTAAGSTGSGHGDSAPDGGAEAPTRRTDDRETVRCRQCGTENERAYRFCRNCVAELPGGALGGATTPSPNSRRMF